MAVLACPSFNLAIRNTLGRPQQWQRSSGELRARQQSNAVKRVCVAVMRRALVRLQGHTM